MPGWHCGPASYTSRGWAVLNGYRHPASPNILYTDGSVRADATRRLAPNDLSACTQGSWNAVVGNSWPDSDFDVMFGTMQHMFPKLTFAN